MCFCFGCLPRLTFGLKPEPEAKSQTSDGVCQQFLVFIASVISLVISAIYTIAGYRTVLFMAVAACVLTFVVWGILWAGCYCSNACVSSIAFLCDIAAVVFYIVQIWLIAESGMARYAIGVIITAVLVALMFLYTAYLVYLIIALQCKGKKTHVKKDGGVKRAWEDVQNEGRGVAGAAKEQEQAAKQGAQKYGNDERNPIKGEYGQAEGQYDAQRNQYGQEATQYGNRTEGYAAEGQGYGNQAGDNADHYRGRAEEAV